MSDEPTGEARPIPRNSDEVVAHTMREMVDGIAHAVLEGKRMDQAHETAIAAAKTKARVDLYRRLERLAWAILVGVAALFIFGRETIASEFVKSWGTIGGAALVFLIGHYTGRQQKN